MAETIREYFRNDDSVKLVVLYGSFAEKREKTGSDVDIALAGDSPLSSGRLAALNVSLAALIQREVDIVDLNRIGGTILTQVLTKGIVLKKKDVNLYAELIKKMLYFEADMAPNIRYIFDYRREKFLNT